jgi:tRNA modification GTPase
MGDARPTLAALATPPGRGGVCILRVSGPGAHAVAGRLCPELPAAPRPRVLYRSRFVAPDGGGLLDEGLVVLFFGPASFTGEDVAELHGHGGLAQSRALLEAVLQAGAEPAGPGAFSRRAVENGRMDLARAEGIAEVVAAESAAGLRAARALMGGALTERVDALIASAAGLLAEWEAVIDFPDEAGDVDEAAWPERLGALGREVTDLAATFGVGRTLRDGARVVLVGPPNAGKSSLLNALAGHERALVDAEPGTTRDVIEARIDLGGRAVTVVDGAGLRAGGAPVEIAGMARLEAAVREADLLIGVFDGSRRLETGETRPLAWLREAEVPTVVVANKSDLGDAGVADLCARLPDAVPLATSATTRAGIDALVQALDLRLGARGPDEGSVVVTLERHHRALCEAAGSIDEAAARLGAGVALDAACEELRAARAALCRVAGRGAVPESLLDAIFARFCIGK